MARKRVDPKMVYRSETDCTGDHVQASDIEMGVDPLKDGKQSKWRRGGEGRLKLTIRGEWMEGGRREMEEGGGECEGGVTISSKRREVNLSRILAAERRTSHPHYPRFRADLIFDPP